MTSNKEYTIINSPELESRKIACFTLDVEQDYGDLLDEPSYEGLEHVPELVDLLRERDVPLTCFVQGSLFETHPVRIKELMTIDTEFEVHSYSHLQPEKTEFESEVTKSKKAYQEFFTKAPLGYRAPRGYFNSKTDYKILVSHGFKFDSSIFPSLRPGVFNNLRKPTKPYFVNDSEILEFPITVLSSTIRIPISLSYIKLLGKPYFYSLKTFTLPNLIIFLLHLHDVFELSSSYKLPLERYSFMYRRIFERIYHAGKANGLYVLDDFIKILQKRNYVFLKLIDIHNLIAKSDKNLR